MKIKRHVISILLTAALVISFIPPSQVSAYSESDSDIASAVYTQLKPVSAEWNDSDYTVSYYDADFDDYQNMVGDSVLITYKNGQKQEFVCTEDDEEYYFISTTTDEFDEYTIIRPEFRDGQTRKTKWAPGTSHDVPVFIDGVQAEGTLKVNVSEYMNIDSPEITCKNWALTYNGKTQHPKVVVKAMGKTIPSSQYTIKWPKKSKKIGFYSFTVKLKDKYRGSDSCYYHIGPKGTKITKVTPGKRSFTVKWKKVTGKAAKNVDGYVVIFSTRKESLTDDYDSWVDLKYISGKNKTSTTIKKSYNEKLGKNMTYYVKIATYKNVKGDQLMSPLSKKAFKVKTK